MGVHVIPNWWKAASLSDVTSKLVDGSHNPPAKQGAGLPMLSAVNINNNKIIFSDYRLISEDSFLLEDRRTRITPGDVLLTIVGAIGRAAVVPETISKFTLQRSVAVITPQHIVSKFLMYQFGSPRIAMHFKNTARGTAQKGVYLKTLGNTEIWIPPLPEQNCIVAKIEELFSELDKGIENLKTARAQLKVYRQALLKHAFEGKLTAQWRAENQGKLETADALLKRIQQERVQRYQQQLAEWENKSPSIPLLQRGKTTNAATFLPNPPLKKGGRGDLKPKAPKPLPPLTVEELAELPELPEGWGWVKLGQLTWSVKDGPHFSPKYVEKGIPFISGGNIRPDGVDFEKAKHISKELHEELSKRCKPEIGDVLYTKGGTTGIARVNTFNVDFNVWVHVAVLKLTSVVRPFYLQHALNSSFCYSQSQKYTHGVGNQDLGLTRMVNIVLAICSIDEQEEIIKIVDDKMSVIDQLDQTITTSLQQAEALRQSILKKAFSGQLVPQDPRDEPASTLLARIRAERVKSPQPPFAKGGRSRSGGGVSAKPRKKAVGDKLSPTAIIPLTSMDKES